MGDNSRKQSVTSLTKRLNEHPKVFKKPSTLVGSLQTLAQTSHHSDLHGPRPCYVLESGASGFVIPLGSKVKAT